MTRPPVWLLHGAGEDAGLWQDVVGAIGSGYAHEFPGHGARGGAPCTAIAQMAEDLVTRMTTGAVLVGHSMGGAVALEVAKRRAALVAGLVLVTAGARMPVNPQLLALVRDDFDEAVRRMVSAATGGRRGAVGEGKQAVAQRFAQTLRRNGARALEAGLRACDRYDGERVLGDIAAPAVVVVGTVDKLTPPALGHALAAGLDADVLTVDGGGHQLPWEAPSTIVEAVGRVIDAASG